MMSLGLALRSYFSYLRTCGIQRSTTKHAQLFSLLPTLTMPIFPVSHLNSPVPVALLRLLVPKTRRFESCGTPATSYQTPRSPRSCTCQEQEPHLVSPPPCVVHCYSLARGGAVASSLTIIPWLWSWALSPLPKKITCTVRSSLRNALLVHAWHPPRGQRRGRV